MKGYYERINVDVECLINEHGKIRLLAMYWKSKRFEISESKLRTYAENYTGKPCNMYICKIEGKEKKIYFNDGAFFVEFMNV